jgi:ribonuclease HII
MKRRSRTRRPTLRLERALWRDGIQYVAGVDEVGRGCLAGPVVAAAVILPSSAILTGIRDSKQLSASRREAFTERIRRQALALGMGVCSPEEIDRLNILQASFEAMRRALYNLVLTPGHVLVDGHLPIPDLPWPVRPVVRGDQLSTSIAAASILAKTERDSLMHRLHHRYPDYGWDTNVGYPTAEHRRALAIRGPSPIHRRSFNLGPGAAVDRPV